MNRDILYGPPPATLEILLEDPGAHDFPAPERIVGGLMPEQALRRPPGLPYSVAEIIAHMNATMRFNFGLIRSPAPGAEQAPVENWPPVSSAEWPGLAEEFLSTLRALRAIASQGRGLDRVLYPATDVEPSWTAGYKLAASVAKHNAYHLGQIVVVRRLIGAWDE